jgi:hypothetical protein
MNRAYPASVEDPVRGCPVPLDTLRQLYHAGPERLSEQLDGIPEATRARLAVFLYGRNHMRQLGVRIAATCDGVSLRRVAGFVGNTLHNLSRQNPSAWLEAGPSAGGRRRISLAESRAAALHAR